MIVYRGMDRHTLDAAYNNSAAVAEIITPSLNKLAKPNGVRPKRWRSLSALGGEARPGGTQACFASMIERRIARVRVKSS
jgi:hypothetical protein